MIINIKTDETQVFMLSNDLFIELNNIYLYMSTYHVEVNLL